MTIQKYVDGVTAFKAIDMNKPINGLEQELNSLKTLVNETVLENQSIIIPNMTLSVTNESLIELQNEEWILSVATPLGIYHGGHIYLAGLIPNLPNTIIDTNVVTIGVPYYMSIAEPGKITETKYGCYVGEFIDSSTFLLKIDTQIIKHTHIRILLDSTKWATLNYPREEIETDLLPYDNIVLVFDGKYIPIQSKYTVNTNGITLTDESYFETLFTTGDVDAFLTSHDCELFFVMPIVNTEHYISGIQSGNSNISVSVSQIGTATVSYTPQKTNVDNAAGYNVVKDITFSSDGKLVITKGKVVERLIGGSNASVDRDQGVVTVSASASKYVELPAHDIMLQGALNQIYPGTINSYVQFPYIRKTSCIYKFYFSNNVDTTKKCTVYCLCFSETGTFDLSLNISTNQGNVISQSPTLSTVIIPLTGTTIDKKTLLSFYPIKNSCFQIQITRHVDSVNLYNVGIQDIIVGLYMV